MLKKHLSEILEIFQSGEDHQLTLKVYSSTKSFPAEELYGLTAQMRRSSYSLPSDIAEGCSRNSDAETNRFLTIASGSVSELEYQVLLSKDLGYLPVNLFNELANELLK
jgi:four helix bundle protein